LRLDRIYVTIGNMPSLELLEMIRDNMGSTVPFAIHVGIQLTTVNDGSAQATLVEQPFTLNHVATAHAGAMFSLAETASGAAMAGTFADEIFAIRPLVRTANISYKKVGRGDLIAHATTRIPSTELRALLATHGRVAFWVDVAIRNIDGMEIAHFEAEWIVTKTGAS
jgi:acyl-coenzyme A thioesterase PaaI-like protein